MKSNLLAFAFLLLCTAPSVASAAVTDFIPLVGIPGIADSDLATTGFGDYINALYRLSISIAALLAVIKIVAAGAKYMLSDIVTHKEDAKKDIQGALLGLLVIIGAVIILTTINTDITKNTIAITQLDDVNGNNTIDRDLQNFLARMKSKDEAICNSADASIGETCEIYNCWSDCSDWCDNEQKGNYTPVTAWGNLTGTFTNKCVYTAVVDGTVAPGDVSGLTFTSQNNYNADQLSQIQGSLRGDIILAPNAKISTSEITLNDLQKVTGGSVINTKSLLDIENNMANKCSGGKVLARQAIVGSGNGETGILVYCIK